MQVKDIMTKKIESINSDLTLVEAAKKMKNLEIGALVVRKDDKIIGMITDRDIIIRAVAPGRDLWQTTVEEIMTAEIFYCYDTSTLKDVAKVMKQSSIHRLVVLDSHQQPAGIITLSDLAVKTGNQHLTFDIYEKLSEPAEPHK